MYNPALIYQIIRTRKLRYECEFLTRLHLKKNKNHGALVQIYSIPAPFHRLSAVFNLLKMGLGYFFGLARLLRRLEHLAFNATGETTKASSRKSVCLPVGRWTGFAKAIILLEAAALNGLHRLNSQSYPLITLPCYRFIFYQRIHRAHEARLTIVLWNKLFRAVTVNI